MTNVTMNILIITLLAAFALGVGYCSVETSRSIDRQHELWQAEIASLEIGAYFVGGKNWKRVEVTRDTKKYNGGRVWELVFVTTKNDTIVSIWQQR